MVRLQTFDQDEFVAGNATAWGMAREAYAYVPADCAEGERCRVHVAFHGCLQYAGNIGDAFYRHAGYNPWADANRIIVLYPEAHSTFSNQNACWDWWGYDDPNYATKSGRQMAAVRGMLDRLAGVVPATPPSQLFAAHTATNYQHWQARRADSCFPGTLCAIGSGELLGYPV